MHSKNKATDALLDKHNIIMYQVNLVQFLSLVDCRSQPLLESVFVPNLFQSVFAVSQLLVSRSTPF